MRLAVALMLTATVVAAGCATPDDAAIDPATTGEPDIILDEARPEPSFDAVDTGPSADLDLNATLAQPPELRVGEWWRIEFESPLTDEKAEFVRVVAGKHDDGYVIGMPHEGWYKEAVIYHTPAFGDMNLDLSYNTHDLLFEPLNWPLEEGQTWQTQFSGGPMMRAEVALDDATTARVKFYGTGGFLPQTPATGDGEQLILELVYDAKVHEVVEFYHQTAVFRVVDHGYDFEGWTTVPRGEDLVFFHGRIGPVVDVGAQPAPVPSDDVELAGGFNRVTFIHVVQPFGPGAYQATATAPSGSTFQSQDLGGTAGLQVNFFEETDPDGTWTLEHIAGGPGVAFTEGIAYHQYDILLPDGAIRSDHSHEVIR